MKPLLSTGQKGDEAQSDSDLIRVFETSDCFQGALGHSLNKEGESKNPVLKISCCCLLKVSTSKYSGEGLDEDGEEFEEFEYCFNFYLESVEVQ